MFATRDRLCMYVCMYVCMYGGRPWCFFCYVCTYLYCLLRYPRDSRRKCNCIVITFANQTDDRDNLHSEKLQIAQAVNAIKKAMKGDMDFISKRHEHNQTQVNAYQIIK